MAPVVVGAARRASRTCRRTGRARSRRSARGRPCRARASAARCSCSSASARSRLASVSAIRALCSAISACRVALCGLGTMLLGRALAALLELTLALRTWPCARMRGSMKASSAITISATTTMAMMAPVVIGSSFLGVARKASRHTAIPMPPTFDLQSHSIHSDGALPPADVVAHAAASRRELLALTDHDTVDGVPEARAAAARARHRVQPRRRAVRRPRRARGPAHPRLRARPRRRGPAAPRCTTSAATARGGSSAMADRLRELGFELDDAPLEARRDAGKPIGRPHLADAVLAHPANAQRLADEGIDGRDALFPPYLVPGAAAYVAAQPPDRPAGDRGHPRRRRRRRLGAPVLGRRPSRRGARHAAGVRRRRARRRRGFYATHTQEQTRGAATTRRRDAAC